MCGIGLIISGLRVDLSSLFPDYKSPSPHSQHEHLYFTLEDLQTVLQRRGPDHLGSRKLYIQLNSSTPLHNHDQVEDAIKLVHSCHSITSAFQGVENDDSVAEFHFIGATLQLRGVVPVHQPFVDEFSNVLVYNGEIFGGLHIDSNSNDAEILLHALAKCCSCNCHEQKLQPHCIENGKTSVLELLSSIKGPWALIYWQDSSKTLWFGRDAFGRRSILVHWPTLDDPRFLLSSVSSPSPKKISDSEVGDQMEDLDFWDELSCGIYSLKMIESKFLGCLVGEVRKHEWTDPSLNELIKWERTYVECKSHERQLPGASVTMEPPVMDPSHSKETSERIFHSNCTVEHCKQDSEIPVSFVNGVSTYPIFSLASHKVLIALRESVMRRTMATMGKPILDEVVPVAVLFSGGLDSMILAALLDKCLDPCYEVDLLNVSFDGQSAPDRISARAGVKELNRISPSRRWNLVEIDADLSNLTSETEHVMSLINPSKTYMDLNIGIALWLAAGGDGWVDMGVQDNFENSCERLKYKSNAKILLVGSGADEQCAGYSRHRTKYRLGGWLGLHEEMKLDMQRIWKRNLGRDDRCISDNGKEARFPFLDEDVIRTLLEIPLWEVADLNKPVGRGDKKILREVAQLLSIREAAFLPKRAIQFGSRIARESNRKNFGSNRAANQASAGSVVIHMPTNSGSVEAISPTQAALE